MPPGIGVPAANQIGGQTLLEHPVMRAAYARGANRAQATEADWQTARGIGWQWPLAEEAIASNVSATFKHLPARRECRRSS